MDTQSIKIIDEIKQQKIADLDKYFESKTNIEELVEFILEETAPNLQYMAIRQITLLHLDAKANNDAIFAKLVRGTDNLNLLEFTIMLIQDIDLLNQLHEEFETREEIPLKYTMMDLMNTRIMDLSELQKVKIEDIDKYRQQRVVDLLYLPTSLIEFAYNFNSSEIKDYIADKVSKLHKSTAIFVNNEMAVIRFMQDFCFNLKDLQFQEAMRNKLKS